MDLPNYFLADLPPGTVLTPLVVTDACQALRRNRALYLADRTTPSLIRTVAGLAADWLDPNFSFRQHALNEGPRETGFSPETLARGLDQFFGGLTSANLQALLVQEFGHVDRLDKLSSSDPERSHDRASIVLPPELIAHIAGGVLPNPTFLSMVLGLLLRAAQVVKCPTGAAFLPRLFAHSLHQREPKLGACLEIAHWPGGTEPLEAALFAEASLVTATGSNETLAALRARLPASIRFAGYGQRVSVACVTREMLSEMLARKMVARAADDVTAWDQLGCLSPHVIYVEPGGVVSAEKFAADLAVELASRQLTQPRGAATPAEAATISYRRSIYEVRAAASPDTLIWSSPASTDWTVVYETEAQFQWSCGHRFVYVKLLDDVSGLRHALGAIEGKISTVGLAATAERAEAIALSLARAGVPRICPLGQMQNPPPAWRHDGRPAFADWVTWADWEMPGV